jgi:hypothetical protein
MKENVDHPSHYVSHPSGVECVDIAEHLSFNLGNALKYLWRAGKKGEPAKEREDCEKALWYLRRERDLSLTDPDHVCVTSPAAVAIFSLKVLGVEERKDTPLAMLLSKFTSGGQHRLREGRGEGWRGGLSSFDFYYPDQPGLHADFEEIIALVEKELR